MFGALCLTWFSSRSSDGIGYTPSRTLFRSSSSRYASRSEPPWLDLSLFSSYFPSAVLVTISMPSSTVIGDGLLTSDMTRGTHTADMSKAKGFTPSFNAVPAAFKPVWRAIHAKAPVRYCTSSTDLFRIYVSTAAFWQPENGQHPSMMPCAQYNTLRCIKTR
eukprot:263076-Rhodomonas_salina.2